MNNIGAKFEHFVKTFIKSEGSYELAITNGQARIVKWTFEEPEPALEQVDSIPIEDVIQERKVKTLNVAVVAGNLKPKRFREGDLVWNYVAGQQVSKQVSTGKLKILIDGNFLEV